MLPLMKSRTFKINEEVKSIHQYPLIVPAIQSFSTNINDYRALFFPFPDFSFLPCIYSCSLKAIFSILFFFPLQDSSHESLEKPDLLGKVLGKQ